MKARVKATGAIIEVKSKVITSLVTGKNILKYIDQKTGVSYFEEELFFPKDLVDDLDYWTRLEHTYAGMAMQGLILTASKHMGTDQEVAQWAREYAHALVQKLKEKEERK